MKVSGNIYIRDIEDIDEYVDDGLTRDTIVKDKDSNDEEVDDGMSGNLRGVRGVKDGANDGVPNECADESLVRRWIRSC